MKRRKPTKRIYVYEDDARLFSGEAKMKGLTQWELFNKKIMGEDDEDCFKKKGFRLEL